MDDLLVYLLNAREPVPAEKLCRRFNLARPALAKHLARFKKMGIVIEHHSGSGYRIVSFPSNRIIPEMVQHYYGGKLPYDLTVLKKTESTNTFAKRMAADGLSGGSVVAAEEQSAGRGRLDRGWTSERGKDLTFTVVLTPDRPVSDFYQFTLLASLAVCQAVEPLFDGLPTGQPVIKWPNDVYVDGKKLCGILSEMLSEEMRIKTIIIGIGINVNSAPSFPKAVSLRRATGADSDRNKLLADILLRLNDLAKTLVRDGFDGIFSEWKKRLGWIGQEVTVEKDGDRYTGVLQDVNPDGSVRVLCGSTERVFYTGDILV